MFEGKNKTRNERGKTSYNRNIINGIVDLATSEIEGVDSAHDVSKKRKQTRIEFEGNQVYVDVFIDVYNGYKVADVAFKVQENIKRGVETMTDFSVKEVNINVLGVVFDAENIKE